MGVVGCRGQAVLLLEGAGVFVALSTRTVSCLSWVQVSTVITDWGSRLHYRIRQRSIPLCHETQRQLYRPLCRSRPVSGTNACRIFIVATDSTCCVSSIFPFQQILQVIVPTTSLLSLAQGQAISSNLPQEEAKKLQERKEQEEEAFKCPICLGKPVAGRMTKCGHVCAGTRLE